MFDSLDEQMKLDDATETTRQERYAKYSAIAVMSIAVFAALYVGLLMIGS